MSSECCEARISYKTIKGSTQRFVTTLDGRKVDLGADVKDEPGIGEMTLTCDKCGLDQKFTAEGLGYSPSNETARQARKFLINNCEKWANRQKEYEKNSNGPYSFLYSPPNPDKFFPRG